MTAVLGHALLVLAALGAARGASNSLLLAQRAPRTLGFAALFATHWVWALAGPAHVAMFLAALLFWLPVVSGRGGPGYVLGALVAADSAALWLLAGGESAAGVELLGGMLPVAVAFVVVAWRKLQEEEARARVVV